MLQQPPASGWYKGDPSIVSYGDTIADDLCFDHLMQLKHLDDGHEEEVEGDSSSICTDCALSNFKEHDVNPDYICEADDFGDVKESQPSVWYRGDPSIVSHGDAMDDDLCSDHAIQLETSAEFLWDDSHDFQPCFAMEEVEDCGAKDCGVDIDAESYYSLCFHDEEFEVECSGAAMVDPSDCNSEVEEDWDCYSN